ncbi:MAG: glycosyltransferase family 4 protein [Candidatus Thorarchaeota archaeon]|nr:glycosyltransferase family 4 protein [Candidatus Thorarchaeota archaeon]
MEKSTLKIGMVSKFHAADGLCIRAIYEMIGLRKRGHKIHAFTQSKKGVPLASTHIHRFPAVQINPHVSWDAPDVPKLIAKESRRLGLEVIHVHTNSGTTEIMLPLFKKNLPPLITTFHLAYADGSTLQRVMFDMGWKFSMAYIKRYDHVILVDPSQKEWALQYGVPEDKISVIRNGVDIDLFSPAPTQQEDDYIDFVFVGRLSPDKGVDILLDAFKKYHKENKKTRLVLVGDGILKHSLDNYGDRRTIHWVGIVPHSQIPSILRRADAFVIPQNIGGLGMSVLEAMSCGLPVITTAIGETKRLVNTDAGILVEPNNVDAVVDAMRQVSEDENGRHKIGKEARKRIKKYYSWNAQIAMVEDVYKRVLDSYA